MAHPQLTVKTIGDHSQINIEGLIQITVLEDGTVSIDLAGKHVEVERNGLQYVVRHEAATQVIEPNKTLIERDDEDVVYGVD